MNARFWDHINGSPVKITLAPGQRLHHYRRDRTEEGWESELNVWEHDGDRVILSHSTDGRDCDGRLSSESESWSGIGELADREYDDLRYPTWHTGKSWQRDYQAEAAGY